MSNREWLNRTVLLLLILFAGSLVFVVAQVIHYVNLFNK